MTLVERFSIFGSLASFLAIFVAISIHFFQRSADKKGKQKSKEDKIKALKILIYDEIKNNFDNLNQLIELINHVENNKLKSMQVNSLGRHAIFRLFN